MRDYINAFRAACAEFRRALRHYRTKRAERQVRNAEPLPF